MADIQENLSPSSSSVFNVHVGILGHVDSGKTTLAKVLSSKASTAAFDKSPQSQERAITLDLGFSAFYAPLPDNASDGMKSKVNQIQFTMVDCPGHASLIKTILGGAQLMDIMLLVIDVTKGVQAQTGEGLVMGEIAMTHRWGVKGTAGRLIVILNKIDALAEESRARRLNKLRTALQNVLKRTAFGSSCLMVELSARSLSTEARNVLVNRLSQLALAIPSLHQDETVKSTETEEAGKASSSFVLAYDHCFQRRGIGAILTGSILRGRLIPKSEIQIPAAGADIFRVRSIQSFGQDVPEAVAGARVGICVSGGVPASSLERGLAASPGMLCTVRYAITLVKLIPYYRHSIRSGQSLHVTMGHTTKTGKVWFFQSSPSWDDISFDHSQEFEFVKEVGPVRKGSSTVGTPMHMLLELDQPIVCCKTDLFLASRLDTEDIKGCRLALHGKLLQVLPTTEGNPLASIKVYRTSVRAGRVARKISEREIIGDGMFDKFTDLSKFLRRKITTISGVEGEISAKFGSTGKFRVVFRGTAPTAEDLKPGARLELLSKRYVFKK